MTADSVQGRVTGLTDRRSECDTLDRLIAAVRDGQSRALVVRGDPGGGKTVQLEYLAGRASAAACRLARAVGVESEMELAFAGLHQLCAPMLDRLEWLPAPQREALRTAFGLAAGPPPDRFFGGLAVLSLLSGVAGDRPLICLVDTRSRWIMRRRRRWGSRHGGWAPTRSGWGSRHGGWAPTRSGWCSRPASRARTWPGCPSWMSEGCGMMTRGRCWPRRWPPATGGAGRSGTAGSASLGRRSQ
jgi:hypothetical protein